MGLSCHFTNCSTPSLSLRTDGSLSQQALTSYAYDSCQHNVQMTGLSTAPCNIFSSISVESVRLLACGLLTDPPDNLLYRTTGYSRSLPQAEEPSYTEVTVALLLGEKSLERFDVLFRQKCPQGRCACHHPPLAVFKFAIEICAVLDQKLNDRVHILGLVFRRLERAMMSIFVTQAEEQMPNAFIVVDKDRLIWIGAMI